MTIICANETTMAADSGTFANGISRPCVMAKIVRIRVGERAGALAASTGVVDDTSAFRAWAQAGMPAPAPQFKQGFHYMILEPDGSIFIGDHETKLEPVAAPAAIGANHELAMGAMLFGATPTQAVDLCIEHTIWARGPTQLELLHPPIAAVPALTAAA